MTQAIVTFQTQKKSFVSSHQGCGRISFDGGALYLHDAETDFIIGAYGPGVWQTAAVTVDGQEQVESARSVLVDE